MAGAEFTVRYRGKIQLNIIFANTIILFLYSNIYIIKKVIKYPLLNKYCIFCQPKADVLQIIEDEVIYL